MTEPATNPYQPPEDESAAVRPGGLPGAVVALLWVGATIFLALRLLGWVFASAPDLLVVFVAVGLAIALAKRMRRRTGLWALWSFVLPMVALVLSQLRRPGSTSELRIGRLVLRTGVVLALIVGCYFASRWIQFSPDVRDACGEVQAYLFTTFGNYADYQDGRLTFDETSITLVGSRLPFAVPVLVAALFLAACLYRSGCFVIVSMAVIGLMVGLGGDILSQLLVILGAMRRAETGNSLFHELASNRGLMLIVQLAVVYGFAAKVAWETACEEFPDAKV